MDSKEMAVISFHWSTVHKVLMKKTCLQGRPKSCRVVVKGASCPEVGAKGGCLGVGPKGRCCQMSFGVVVW